MKKTYIREGSLAWYCKKLWKPATAIVLTGAILACATAFNENGTNTYEQAKKPSEVNLMTCTAQSVEEMICVQCDKYGVDAKLAIAIARLETGNFTSPAYEDGNNVGGLSVNEEPMAFPSLERGVEAFVMNLYHNYIAEGLDTPDEIAGKYCPLNAEHWAELVAKIMEG